MSHADAEVIAGAGQCPRCKCRKTARAPLPGDLAANFYGKELEVCRNPACGAAWEPIDRTLLWDPDDQLCTFKVPCDDCAFRPNSVEQRNGALAKTLADLKANPYAAFYCHKGVPIDPSHQHGDSGFAYPKGADGRYKTGKLRLCRGYMNMVRGQMAKAGLNLEMTFLEKNQRSAAKDAGVE